MLYDRDRELSRLLEAPTAVVVVSGDPGSGKSAILSEAATQDSRFTAAPVRVPRRPGALQIGLFNGLSAAVAERASDESFIRRAGEVLAHAAENVAQQRLRSLAGAAAGFVIGAVKDRLGDTIGGLLDDLIDEVSHSANDQLQSRITAASDPDVIEVFNELAGRVREFVGQDLVLALDDVDRLIEGDFRQLQDLVEGLPPGIALRLGHSTPDAASSSRVLALEELGTTVVRLAGLSADALDQWLEDAQVGGVDLELILRVTAGLPLHVDAAIAHLRSGGSIADLSVDESFAIQTQAAFGKLETSVQRACVMLSAFTDPPTQAQIMELLECREDELLLLERQLEDSRMFVTKVEGRPWFHDLRRRAIWEGALREEEREYSARRALNFILTAISRKGQIPTTLAMDFARLATFAPAFCNEHERLDIVLGLGANGLAIVAAVLELIERPGNPAIAADAALVHAQEVFAAAGDLTEGLRDLQQAGIVVVTENENMAVVGPTWGLPAALIAVHGRVATELKRAAIPGIASVAFDVAFRPRLGEFIAAHYGVGRPRISQLSKFVSEMRFDRQGSTVNIREVWGVMTRSRLGGTDLYSAIAFGSQDARDKALVQLPGANVEIARQRLEVVDIWPWPSLEPVRDLRFINAAELALGARVAGPHGNAGKMPQRTFASIDEGLQLRVGCLRALAELADPIERLAMGAEREQGLVFFRGESSLVVCEVAGLHGVVEVPPIEKPFGPFFQLEIARAAGLNAGQPVGRINWSPASKPTDPLPTVLEESYKALVGFNSSQKIGLRRTVSLEADGLREEIQQALDLSSRDAVAMRDAGLFAGLVDRPLYRTLYMVVSPGPEQQGLVTGANGVVHSAEFPADSKNTVHLHVVEDAPDDLHCGQSVIQQYWQLDREALAKVPSSHSSLTFGLPRLLGFNERWVRFER